MAFCAPADDDQQRLTCHIVAAARKVASFEEDLRDGLLAPPRAFPPKYFYNGRGSELFQNLLDP